LNVANRTAGALSACAAGARTSTTSTAKSSRFMRFSPLIDWLPQRIVRAILEAMGRDSVKSP
jgi:hypothetical protein